MMTYAAESDWADDAVRLYQAFGDHEGVDQSRCAPRSTPRARARNIPRRSACQLRWWSRCHRSSGRRDAPWRAAAALIVLLITCANVANLLLSRSSERRKEIALRMSVGSGPLRVVRQLLAESVGYALLGGIGGLLLARWLIDVVVGLNATAVPRLTETTLDFGVMAVAPLSRSARRCCSVSGPRWPSALRTCRKC
jgi:hypothetical protein